MILVDGTEIQLADTLRPSALQATMDGFVSDALDPIIRAAAKGHRSGEVLDAQPAASVLHEAATRVEQRLRSWAQVYSPLRWLWMLRRLPDVVFAGPLSTNLTYDLALAEVIAGGSARREVPTRNGDSSVSYPFDRNVAQRLARLCCGVRLLSHLHSMQRWAGKGVPLRFTREARFNPLPTEEMLRAVELYDERVAGRQTPTARFGSILFEPFQDVSCPSVLRVDRIKPLELEVPESGGGTRVLARYTGCLWDVSRLKELCEDARLGALTIVTDEIALCLLLMRIAIGYVRAHEQGWRGLLQRGYLLSRQQLITRQMESVLSERDPVVELLPSSGIPATVEELIDRAMRAAGSTWPLVPGAMVRSDQDVLCLDLASISARLDKLLLFPEATGSASNARGDHFELSVQRAIDRTPWRLREELRPLRGRTLRFKGDAITDFDAIATRGTTLLAVSCKSVRDPGDYETGAFNTVRNAVTLVDASVRKWEEHIAFIREHPRGDNYDFSAFTSLLGVVCTPHVLFVPLGPATRPVASGLPAACTAEELEQWLSERTVGESRIV